MSPKNKPWGTWLLIGLLALVIVPMVFGALPDIWEESGAGSTVSSAGSGAGHAVSSAGHAASSGVSSLLGVAMGIGTIVVLFIGLRWLLRSGSGGFGGGGGKGGQRDLQWAQRDEYAAIAQARSEGQRAVQQAQMEATRRRNAAVQAAQQMINGQDGWS